MRQRLHKKRKQESQRLRRMHATEMEVQNSLSELSLAENSLCADGCKVLVEAFRASAFAVNLRKLDCSNNFFSAADNEHLQVINEGKIMRTELLG